MAEGGVVIKLRLVTGDMLLNRECGKRVYTTRM